MNEYLINFAALFGFFLFGQIPDVYSFIGYFIIIGLAVWMFLYNTGKLSRNR